MPKYHFVAIMITFHYAIAAVLLHQIIQLLRQYHYVGKGPNHRRYYVNIYVLQRIYRITSESVFKKMKMRISRYNRICHHRLVRIKIIITFYN